MATEPELDPTRAARADSVIGITSLSDSVRMAQDLQAAIASFATGDGFLILSRLTDRIPVLEQDIEKKGNQISQLTLQLATEKENHSTYDQKQLSTYNDRYDAWKSKEASFHATMEELQKGLEAREIKNRALDKEGEELKAKSRGLAEKFKVNTAELKEKEQEVKRLKQQLTEARTSASGYAKQLSESQSRITMLETSSETDRKESEKLKADCNLYKDRLNQVISFSVTLKKLNLEDTANELASLWNSALRLVGKFFGQDLPDDMLRNDWDNLHDNAIFKHQIPLPHSNSNVAKKMRIAVVLGILARLVDKYIFQPTYLLNEDSGFRELLWKQATEDQMKERFTRGVILSMFPEENESHGKDRLFFVVEDLFKDANVEAFLAHGSVASFRYELDSFLVQAQSVWHSIQHGRQRLEPNFQYRHDADFKWHELDLSVVEGKEDVQPRPPVTVDGLADEFFVLFPRIYLMESVPEPITAGTVLRRAHCHAAAQEVHRTTASSLFSQPLLNRQRTRPSRSMTTSGDGARDGRTKERKPVTSTYV